MLPAGKVTIPAVGQVCVASYLHAYREGGSIYQPVYLAERKDILAEDCTTDKQKYKIKPAGA